MSRTLDNNASRNGLAPSVRRRSFEEVGAAGVTKGMKIWKIKTLLISHY